MVWSFISFEKVKQIVTKPLKSPMDIKKYCHNRLQNITQMDDFKTVWIKKKILIRYKSFSRKISNSYSKTLDMIMNFFEWHGFLPSDRFGKSMVEKIIKNRKRTNASIATIKDIEKSRTLLTIAMSQSLFEQNSMITDQSPNVTMQHVQ